MAHINVTVTVTIEIPDAMEGEITSLGSITATPLDVYLGQQLSHSMLDRMPVQDVFNRWLTQVGRVGN